jgi:hypothetical protein
MNEAADLSDFVFLYSYQPMDKLFRLIKIFVCYTALSLFACSSSVKAQLLRDSTILNLVKKDIDCIYNLQFREARDIYAEIVTAYPEHPVVYLIRGMITYWENYPLLNSSPSKVTFEEDLRQCIKAAEKNTKPEYEAEYLLANLSARGFMLMYYSDNNLVMEVIPLASSSYKYMRRSFDFTSDCTDLYYFTGVYNYYIEAYPRAYPVYKTLTFMFPSGNMKEGLSQLNTAATKSVVLRAESAFILTYIYENFENNYFQAHTYSEALYKLYPENLRFLASYIKNLLLLKRYDEADEIIESDATKKTNAYFKAQLLIFKGILSEKKYLDNKAAEQYYNQGIREISPFGDYGSEYAAYGYFGLSRISDAKGEKNASQLYRKEALRLADFKKINFDK